MSAPSDRKRDRQRLSIANSLRAVSEYCWISRLVSGMVQRRSPSVFPIALPTVFGDDLRLSLSNVGSSHWFQEWLGTKARHLLETPLLRTPSENPFLL